jgi:hypothetical protein
MSHELGRFGRWCIRGLNAPFHAPFRETTAKRANSVGTCREGVPCRDDPPPHPLDQRALPFIVPPPKAAPPTPLRAPGQPM